MVEGKEEETTRGTKGTGGQILCLLCLLWFLPYLTSLPAVSTAAATTAAAVPAAATAAIFAWGHRPCFGNCHVTSAVFGAIELLDGIRGFLIRRHLDESETFAAARITICDDFCGLNASRLREDFLQ